MDYTKRHAKSPGPLASDIQVSDYNFVPEVAGPMEFAEPLLICDSTIRKIDITPGVPYPIPIEGKLRIAQLLDEIGVKQVGVNPLQFPGSPRGSAIQEGIMAIVESGFSFDMEASIDWVVIQERDYRSIELLAELGVDIVHVQVPGSETGREWIFPGWSWSEIMGSGQEALRVARDCGLKAGVVMSDVTRGDLGWLQRSLKDWIDSGAESVFVADTYGTLSPEGTRFFVSELVSSLPETVPLIYHVHDDFGLANAQAIAAASAGAYPDVNINGIGERAFADMASVVVALESLYGIDTGIRWHRFAELSALVDALTTLPPRPQRPVVGVNQFIPLGPEEYVRLLEGKPFNSTPFPPERIGLNTQLLWWNGLVTKQTIAAKLSAMDLDVSEEEVERVVHRVRQALSARRSYPSWLTDTELEDLISQGLS